MLEKYEYDNSTLKLMKLKLQKQRDTYQKNSYKKWIMMGFGFMVGSLVGYTFPQGINLMNNSLYKRESLEQIMEDYLGYANVKDAMTDELLVVAYNYNGQEPRFFSKWWSQMAPNYYDVPMSIATGASSAAPLYFEP